jgi:hypothetical protein
MALPKAYVIEVLSDEQLWTSMVQEYGAILNDLKAAPQPAVAITIYEWMQVAPVRGDWFTRFPTWRFVRSFPWALERDGYGH